MLIFLDTEFTDFIRSDLISIGLVGEDGREFYAERTDYNQNACSDFVHKTVLPLLGRLPGAACSRSELTDRVREWFEQLPELAIIVYDYDDDWNLLVKAMLGQPIQKLPDTFGADKLHLDSFAITHPVFEQAHGNTYTPDLPQHHALADARALMAGYRAWRAFMEKIWRIQ